ncbi:MAG: gamma-glutamyltransferase family protein [Gammaproteobacteria bacterium]|nr:gamma-glutamyltransferase family protein [Gammaproteobacteria bacterium]
MVATRTGSFRPPIMGTTHAVSSGHSLSSAAAFRIPESGGNATDAGVAAGIAINVLLPDMTSFGGVAPIMIYEEAGNSVSTISGLGRWPRAASLAHFVDERDGKIPVGVERTVVPAAAGAWLTALEEHGTMSFAQVVAPALELARDGFPMHLTGATSLAQLRPIFDMWPSTAEIFAPGGQPISFQQKFVQTDLARTFERMTEVEQQALGRGREGAIAAVREFFYTGEIGREIVDFIQREGGFLSAEDMAEFAVGHEQPVIGSMGGYDIYTCGPWCQGPVLAQAVQTLAGDDLHALGHNSPDYVHLLVEALDLAFADRDAFYGDPDLVDVPLQGLLSKDYAAVRREQIDATRAFGAMPPAGDPWRFEGRSVPEDYAYEPPAPAAAAIEPDTSYVCVVDRWGNAFSATPSDTLGGSPIVPGLGFVASNRGSQNWLDTRHPSALAPWKRPRLTPSPAIVLFEDRLFMPFGTPGGDTQPQSMLQVLLNVVTFGMDVQSAIEAPRFQSMNFPNSFFPHSYEAGLLRLEQRIGEDVGAALEKLGHGVEWLGPVSAMTGAACAIVVDHNQQTLAAGADMRRESYAIGR